GAVYLEDSCGMVGDGAAIQQIPRRAVGIDCPGTDHTGVTEIQPTVAGPVHLPVRLRHQHRLSLMDGDLRGANLNLERHFIHRRTAMWSFALRGPPQAGGLLRNRCALSRPIPAVSVSATSCAAWTHARTSVSSLSRSVICRAPDLPQSRRWNRESARKFHDL